MSRPEIIHQPLDRVNGRQRSLGASYQEETGGVIMSRRISQMDSGDQSTGDIGRKQEQ